MDMCVYCQDSTCPVKIGTCHCGCGRKTRRTVSAYYKYEDHLIPVGSPHKWIKGHWMRTAVPKENEMRQRHDEGLCPHCSDNDACPVGMGFCHCGCGKETNVCAHTNKNRENFTGLPSKYISGHHSKRSLTRREVRHMRYLYATDETHTLRSLGRHFGISYQSVRDIVRFETYKEAGIATTSEVKEEERRL